MRRRATGARPAAARTRAPGSGSGLFGRFPGHAGGWQAHGPWPAAELAQTGQFRHHPQTLRRGVAWIARKPRNPRLPSRVAPRWCQICSFRGMLRPTMARIGLPPLRCCRCSAPAAHARPLDHSDGERSKVLGNRWERQAPTRRLRPTEWSVVAQTRGRPDGGRGAVLGLKRGVPQVPLGVEGGLTARSSGGDGLPVGVIDEISGRKHTRQIGQG
jgi:hypothetical protein